MDRKIKIIYVITGLTLGGAEMTLKKIVLGLPKEYEPIVVSLTKGGLILGELKKRGVRAVSLSGKSKYDLRIISRFYHLLKKEKPEILHSFLFHANILSRVIGSWLRVPHIFSSIRNEYFGGRFRRVLITITDRLAEKTIVPSKKVQETMIKKGIVSQSRCLVIYNGYPVDLFLSDSPLKKKNEFVFLSVGRLHTQKGYEYLLTAFKKINEKYPHTRLTIVGSGELENSLRKKAVPAVSFIPATRDVIDYYKSADAFVLTSLWEGFCNVLVEALLSSLPTIATRVGGAEEVIKNTSQGILITPKSIEEIYSAMEKILSLSEEERKTIGEEARKAGLVFSEERMIDAYKELYENTLRHN